MKVEKNIPLPEKSSAGARKYPFHEMDVGDSFFVAGVMVKDAPKIRSAANGYGQYNKKEFMTLTVPGGVRVWRKK